MKKLLLLLVSISCNYATNAPVEKIFTTIYEQNRWGDPDTVSSGWSNLAKTREIRVEIPKLLQELDIKILLDAACGDCYWISHIDLPVEHYIGVDIVKALVEQNKKKFANNKEYTFYHLDIIEDSLPKADLILCRDCLIVLTFDHILQAIKNFKKSGAKYLLASTCTRKSKNKNRFTGHVRPINLQLAPFNFPKPILLITEKYTLDNDRCLGLWLLQELAL